MTGHQKRPLTVRVHRQGANAVIAHHEDACIIAHSRPICKREVVPDG